MPLGGRRQAPRAGNGEGFGKPAERAARPGLHMSQKVKPRFRGGTGCSRKMGWMLVLRDKGASRGGV